MVIQTAATITAVVVGAIILIGLYIGKKSSDKSDEYGGKIYSIRTIYFGMLMVIIVLVLIITLKSDEIPYPDAKSTTPDIEVKVTGRVWYWELDKEILPVGKTIRFSVTTEDVTHGFGLYSPEGKILAQVQVMPGYTNELLYTFQKPGEYKILCMEYCGVAHHTMISTIQVIDENVQDEGENK